MIWLPFSNIGLVVAHYEKRLGKLDVVDEANQLIFTVSEGTPEVDYAEDTEGPLQ